MSEMVPTGLQLGKDMKGTLVFAPDVIANMAGLAATEIEGVASMAQTSVDFQGFLRKGQPARNFTKGVKVDIDDNVVTVDLTITVEYGSPIPDVALAIQENVKKQIETMAGLSVKNVDVHVLGVSFDRVNRDAAELERKQQLALEESVRMALESEKTAEMEEASAQDAESEAEEKPAQTEVDAVADDSETKCSE